MDLTTLFFFVAIVFTAGVIQGASGFGFGLFSVGLLALLFSVKETVLIAVALAAITSLTVVLQLWRHINWGNVAPVLGTVFLGRLIAFPLLRTYGDSRELKYWLAFVLLVFALHLLYKTFHNAEVRVRISLPVALLLGLFSGITGGLFSMGGPWLVVYFLNTHDDARSYKATLQVTFVLGGLMTLGLHGFAGDFDATILKLAFIGSLATIVGTWLGVYLTRKTKLIHIRRIACVVILFASINTLFKI